MVVADQRISERHVRDVLDSLISTTTNIDSKNPLLHITLVAEFLSNPDLPHIENANEYAIQYILMGIIEDIFEDQCRAVNLSIPDNAIAIRDATFFKKLGLVDSSELWGFAMLYSCYVHADWNISIGEFTQLCSLVDRTARRYRETSILRLTRILIQEEWQARIRQRKTRIMADIPNRLGSGTRLIGRDDQLATIHNITRNNFASTILVTGIAGVGKTALVGRYIHTLLEDENLLFDVVWISSAKSTSQVREILIDRISPYNLLNSIREILYINPVVVILDGIDSLQDIDLIDELLDELKYAQVILTSRQKIAILASKLTITLTGLSINNAEFLLQQTNGSTLVEEMKLSKSFEKLFTFTGGNPLGLLVGATHFSLGLFSELPKKTLDQIFDDLFNNMTSGQQTAWIVLAFFPAEFIDQKQLLLLFQPMLLSTALNTLVSYHVATFTDDARYISIAPSAAYYIRETVFPSQIIELKLIFEAFLANLEKAQTVFPLSLRIMHRFTQMNVIQVNNSLFISTLGRLLPFAKSTEDRETSRLWYEICDTFHILSNLRDDEVSLFYCQLLIRYGRWMDARTQLNVLIKECGSRGNFDIQSHALIELAKLYKMIGEYDKAIVILSRIERFPNLQKNVTPAHLLQKARIAIDRHQMSEAQAILSHISADFHRDLLQCELEILTGSFEQAILTLGSCFERAGNNQHHLSHLHVLLGRIYEGQSKLDEALEQYFIGMSYFSDNHEIANLARVWTNIGVIYYRREELETAAQYFVKALRVQSALGDQLGLALTKHNYELLPEVYRIMG